MVGQKPQSILEAQDLLKTIANLVGLKEDECCLASSALDEFWSIFELSEVRWPGGRGPLSEAIAAIFSEKLITDTSRKRSMRETRDLVCASIRHTTLSDKWAALTSPLADELGHEALEASWLIVSRLADPIDLALGLEEIDDRRSLLHAPLTNLEKNEILSGRLSIAHALKNHGIADVDDRVAFLRGQYGLEQDPQWFVANYSKHYADHLYKRYGFEAGMVSPFSYRLFRVLFHRNESDDTLKALEKFGYEPQEIWDEFFEQIPPSSVAWFERNGVDVNASVQGERVHATSGAVIGSPRQRRKGHPLNIAVRGGNFELAKALHQCGSSIDRALDDGPSYVLYAVSDQRMSAKEAHERTTVHLAEFSAADIKAAGWQRSPHQLAKGASHDQMVKHLKSRLKQSKS